MPTQPDDELNEMGFNLVLDALRLRKSSHAKLNRIHREVAAAVIFDTSNKLLLQQRDDKLEILCPGMVSLFGGHRENSETFLECIVRELCEELGYWIPPEQFDLIARISGQDLEVPNGTICAEFFVLRNVETEQLTITEGSLKVVERDDLPAIQGELTPYTMFALRTLGLVN